MSTAKWAAPSAQGSNIASTSLDSLGNGLTSAFVTYDNSTNLDLYANVEVDLGSFTSLTGASITLRAYATANAGGSVPDDIGSVGGGDAYTIPLTVGTSAKKVIFPMIRIYPFSMRLQVTNNAGASFASSSNSIKVQSFNESIA